MIAQWTAGSRIVRVGINRFVLCLSRRCGKAMVNKGVRSCPRCGRQVGSCRRSTEFVCAGKYGLQLKEDLITVDYSEDDLM